MFEKIKNNKPLKIMWNIIYAMLVVFVVLILIVVILQRVSNNNMSLGGFRIFNIISESMVPKYQIGDILLSKKIDDKDLKVGDDVVYIGEKGSFSGKTVTHQIVQIEENNGQYTFHTKGIANEEEDPLVNSNQIRGKVIYKFISLTFISKIVNNLLSFYFSIFVPIAIIIFVEIRKIINSMKNNNKDDEDEKNKKED